MDDRQYQELLNAILDLRNATEIGFVAVNGRFDDVDKRLDNVDKRFDNVDGRFDDVYRRLDGLDRRFSSLESRFEEGFRSVSVTLTDIRGRLIAVEQHRS